MAAGSYPKVCRHFLVKILTPRTMPDLDLSIPQQLWAVTIGMRTGGTLNMITSWTAEEITAELVAAKVQGREFEFRAINPENNSWPVTINGDPENVVLRLVTPFKQYLAGRPNLLVN